MNLLTKVAHILALDATFKEEDHPRGQPENAGEFVKKGSGSVGKKTKTKAKVESKGKGGEKTPNKSTDVTVNKDGSINFGRFKLNPTFDPDDWSYTGTVGGLKISANIHRSGYGSIGTLSPGSLLDNKNIIHFVIGNSDGKMESVPDFIQTLEKIEKEKTPIIYDLKSLGLSESSLTRETHNELLFWGGEVNGKEVTYFMDGDSWTINDKNKFQSGKGVNTLKKVLGPIKSKKEYSPEQKRFYFKPGESRFSKDYKVLVDSAPPLTLDQYKAINFYTKNDYQQINSQLRETKDKYKGELIEKIKNIKDYLDTASLPQDATLYRVIGAEVVKDFQKGQIFTDAGFISTSAVSFFKNDKEHPLLEINAPKGAKAAAIGQYSHYPKEKEVLLQAGSKFRIDSVDKKANIIKVTLL